MLNIEHTFVDKRVIPFPNKHQHCLTIVGICEVNEFLSTKHYAFFLLFLFLPTWLKFASISLSLSYTYTSTHSHTHPLNTSQAQEITFSILFLFLVCFSRNVVNGLLPISRALCEIP